MITVQTMNINNDRNSANPSSQPGGSPLISLDGSNYSFKFCGLVTFSQLSLLSSPQAAGVKGAAVFCPDVPVEQIKAFSASAAAAPSSSCYSDFGNKHSIIFSARLTTPFIFFILPCLSFSFLSFVSPLLSLYCLLAGGAAGSVVTQFRADRTALEPLA